MIGLIAPVVTAIVTMIGAIGLERLGVSSPAYFTLYGFSAATIYAIVVAGYIDSL